MSCPLCSDKGTLTLCETRGLGYERHPNRPCPVCPAGKLAAAQEQAAGEKPPHNSGARRRGNGKARGSRGGRRR